jgi:predicted small lipoprotein YifL
MKKSLALLLTLVLIFTFAGCGKQDKGTTEPSDVTYFDGETTTSLNKETISAQVAEGKLTVEFEAITQEQVNQTHTHGDTHKADVALKMESADLVTAISPSGFVEEQHRKIGENYIRYECGSSMSAYFYYTNDDRQNGLASVVYYGTAYGFEPKVTTKEQVLQVMGTPTTQGNANEKALSMFLFYEQGYTYVDYLCGTNHVSFFFHSDGTLGATVLYQDGLWIY